MPKTTTNDPNLPQIAPKEKRLKPKQLLFVNEYLVDFNGERAAIAAGYSKHSARGIAKTNIKKSHIKAVIDAEIAKRNANAEGRAERVIKELELLAFSDMADFVEIAEGGEIRAYPIDTLAKGKSRIIRKVKEKRVIRTEKGTKDKPDGDQILDDTYEFELHDKVKSLELLARHHGLLHDKTEVDLKETVRPMSDMELAVKVARALVLVQQTILIKNINIGSAEKDANKLD